MCAKKGFCSLAQRKVSLNVAFMSLYRGIVGETLDKTIRCDGFNKDLTVVFVFLMLSVL